MAGQALLVGSSSVLAERVVAPPTPCDSVCREWWGHVPSPPPQLLGGCDCGTQEPRAQGQLRALCIGGSCCQVMGLLEVPRLLADCQGTWCSHPGVETHGFPSQRCEPSATRQLGQRNQRMERVILASTSSPSPPCRVMGWEGTPAHPPGSPSLVLPHLSL